MPNQKKAENTRLRTILVKSDRFPKADLTDIRHSAKYSYTHEHGHVQIIMQFIAINKLKVEFSTLAAQRDIILLMDVASFFGETLLFLFCLKCLLKRSKKKVTNFIWYLQKFILPFQ